MLNFPPIKNPLHAILCGYERGGTTLLLEILRQHPDIDAGFEGGFLLGKTPKDFLNIEPYATNIQRGWQLKEGDIEYICKSIEWPQAYRRLRERSGMIPDKNVLLIDKTPKYMESLTHILDKVPRIPCVVLVRDPRAVLWSWAKHNQSPLEAWIELYLEQACNRYSAYGHGWEKALISHHERILLVQYESLCMNPEVEIRRIFSFLHLSFQKKYLQFSSRFINTHGNTISTKFLMEYPQKFSQDIQNRILKNTAAFRQWHWNNPETAQSCPVSSKESTPSV